MRLIEAVRLDRFALCVGFLITCGWSSPLVAQSVSGEPTKQNTVDWLQEQLTNVRYSVKCSEEAWAKVHTLKGDLLRLHWFVMQMPNCGGNTAGTEVIVQLNLVTYPVEVRANDDRSRWWIRLRCPNEEVCISTGKGHSDYDGAFGWEGKFHREEKVDLPTVRFVDLELKASRELVYRIAKALTHLIQLEGGEYATPKPDPF